MKLNNDRQKSVAELAYISDGITNSISTILENKLINIIKKN